MQNNENNQLKPKQSETIVAVATASGRAGIGVVRLSGSNIKFFAEGLLGSNKTLPPRQAIYSRFLDVQSKTIDEGLVLFFPGPHSYTGEDVLEFQGHGGPVVLDAIVNRCIELGARLARPGEFSERAFLNDKMDLAQVEGVMDLINASSLQAARSAVRSMQGEFSVRVNRLTEAVVDLRIYVEAAIDFPEEEIDFLADNRLLDGLNHLVKDLTDVIAVARQGSLLSEGLTIVLAGKPNAGKSSLLNALVGMDTAIVTPVAGTTRDVLREQITLQGMPISFVDTAGLRDTQDEIEKEGIHRAWKEIEMADLVLFVVDGTKTLETNIENLWPEYFKRFPNSEQTVVTILNKIDACHLNVAPPTEKRDYLAVSAKYRTGLDELIEYLLQTVGYQHQEEGVFSARRRHLDALKKAHYLIEKGIKQFEILAAGELLAEDLRQAQGSLAEITGEFTPDDLLGRLFSSFCIGK